MPEEMPRWGVMPTVVMMRSARAEAVWIAGMLLVLGAHGAAPPHRAAQAASDSATARWSNEPASDEAAASEVPRILERAVTSEVSTGSKTLDILLNLPPGALGTSSPVLASNPGRSPGPTAASAPGAPVPSLPAQPEILDKPDRPEPDPQAVPPELQRPKWSGNLGGGIGNPNEGRPPGERGGNASEDDLRHLLPRSLIAWLKENRDEVLYAAVAVVLLAGVVGWLRERAESRQRGSRHTHRRHHRRHRHGHRSREVARSDHGSSGAQRGVDPGSGLVPAGAEPAARAQDDRRKHRRGHGRHGHGLRDRSGAP